MTADAAAARTRFAGGALALLLQIAFIAAFLHAFTAQPPPRQRERELTFFLPRLLPKPAPVTLVPRAPSAPQTLPLYVQPLLSVKPPANDTAILQNLGRSLFGCAPESYASLTPQQRALCPRLGDGVAIQSAPNPLNTPSHAKTKLIGKKSCGKNGRRRYCSGSAAPMDRTDI